MPAGMKVDDGVQIWTGWGPIGAASAGPGNGIGPAAEEDVAGGCVVGEAPDGVLAPRGPTGAAGKVWGRRRLGEGTRADGVGSPI